MRERGNKIDLYTLADRPELKGREMLRYLSELTNAVDSGVNVLDHARQLANTEIRRRMCLFGYAISARAVSDPAMNSQYGRPPIPRAFWIGRQQK